jgi:hypothetical protein
VGRKAGNIVDDACWEIPESDAGEVVGSEPFGVIMEVASTMVLDNEDEVFTDGADVKVRNVGRLGRRFVGCTPHILLPVLLLGLLLLLFIIGDDDGNDDIPSNGVDGRTDGIIDVVDDEEGSDVAAATPLEVVATIAAPAAAATLLLRFVADRFEESDLLVALERRC